MTTRDQIMKDFARKRGLLCSHRQTSAIVELVPRYVEPHDADLALYADLSNAESADWIIHEIDLDPEKSPPPEPYIGDAVRHWQRIQTMQKMLIAAGIDGVEEIEAVPAGWLAVMETAVDGFIARLALEGGDAHLNITQIKEKWAELRVYIAVRGDAELVGDLRRIALWATAASQDRCMVTGRAGTVDDHPWKRTLSQEMQVLRTQSPERFRELIYPTRK